MKTTKPRSPFPQGTLQTRKLSMWVSRLGSETDWAEAPDGELGIWGLALWVKIANLLLGPRLSDVLSMGTI